jgi:thioester reductase-like protein
MDGAPIPLRRGVPESDGQVHLVTGATGFVGAALVLELLERTGGEVMAVVRPGTEGANARFFAAIRHAADAYGVELGPAARERCRVAAGDVLAPGCGVDAGKLGRVEQVWHCAASLRYENRYADEIHATNVDGTRHALELAERLGAQAFNYVSTAYVAGRREGLVLEEAPGESGTNNRYEQSKIEAERLVAAAPSMRVRILRPSVVVGHSQTLAATTFSGFYGFLRQLVQFRGMVDRTQQGLLERAPLRIRLDPDARLNLVPIDAVASEAARIGLTPEAGGVYHLTHDDPPMVGQVVRSMFAVLGLHEPLFVSSADELEWLDSRFDERLDFYGAYIRGQKRFQRVRADEALGGVAALKPAYDSPMIEAMGRWYLDVLEQERRQLPVAR